MDASNKKYRQVDSISLNETITVTSSSKQFIALGCLDDSLSIWQNKLGAQFDKNPYYSWSGSVTGIIDIKFSEKSTYMAVSSMDSIVRIWDMASKNINIIECPVMSAWKIQFMGDQLAVAGDLGRVSFYDLVSKQVTKKFDFGEIFLNSFGKSNTQKFLAAGNNTGDLYISNLQNKNKIMNLKPHYKMLRSLAFTQDSSKIITASDDTTLKIVDILSQKVSGSLQGHKETVSCVKTHPTDSRIAYSCSFDKSLKIWDLRMKSSVDSFQTGGALWSLQALGKYVVAGGQNKVMSIFSLE